MERSADRERLHSERSARRHARDLRHRGARALHRRRALLRRVGQGCGALEDHRQRPEEGLQHRRQRRLPHRPRHVPRRPQRLPVRHQSRGREMGLADGQRGTRQQRELGRHLGREDADHRDRLVRGDLDSVPHAEVRRRRSAGVGDQLRAQAAAAQRRQLLVAAAAHLRCAARVAGRHARRGCAGCTRGRTSA